MAAYSEAVCGRNLHHLGAPTDQRGIERHQRQYGGRQAGQRPMGPPPRRFLAQASGGEGFDVLWERGVGGRPRAVMLARRQLVVDGNGLARVVEVVVGPGGGPARRLLGRRWSNTAGPVSGRVGAPPRRVSDWSGSASAPASGGGSARRGLPPPP